MSLPADFARCPGMDWDPFGVQPECLSCARLQGEDRPGMVWVEPPQRMPCENRIPMEDE